MKNPRLIALAAAMAGILAAGTTGCTTYYDPYGYPHQAVDPALAVAGIAAAGLIGYAIAEGNDDHHHRHGSYYRGGHGGYHRGHGGYGGGYGGYYDGYCR